MKKPSGVFGDYDAELRGSAAPPRSLRIELLVPSGAESRYHLRQWLDHLVRPGRRRCASLRRCGFVPHCALPTATSGLSDCARGRGQGERHGHGAVQRPGRRDRFAGRAGRGVFDQHFQVLRAAGGRARRPGNQDAGDGILAVFASAAALCAAVRIVRSTSRPAANLKHRERSPEDHAPALHPYAAPITSAGRTPPRWAPLLLMRVSGESFTGTAPYATLGW
jgi:hypothetical protein